MRSPAWMAAYAFVILCAGATYTALVFGGRGLALALALAALVAAVVSVILSLRR